MVCALQAGESRLGLDRHAILVVSGDVARRWDFKVNLAPASTGPKATQTLVPPWNQGSLFYGWDFNVQLGPGLVRKDEQGPKAGWRKPSPALEPEEASMAKKEEKFPEPPFAPTCWDCKVSMKFLTATGGGAGMVFLIFKCPSCGKARALK